MSGPVALSFAVVLLLGNAFFVASEFAMISARRSQIEPRAAAGSRSARAAINGMENIALVIGVNQLGITVCSLLLGAVGEPALAEVVDPLLELVRLPESAVHPVAFALALAVVVYLHVVLGEMIPKNIALAGPERAVLFLAPAIWAFVTVLRPIILVVNAVASGVLRLFGVRLQDEVSSTYTREEVAALVEESRGEGLLEDDEYDRLSGALGFTEKTVDAVLLRPESLTTVVRGSSAAEVEAVCATTGFSRFPVEDDAGELLGYLHIKDVLVSDEDRRRLPVEDKWVRPFATVRHDATLQEALEVLQRRGAHMARVLAGDADDADDDAGRTLGLATLEDIIEELVGEIRDAAHLEDSL